VRRHWHETVTRTARVLHFVLMSDRHIPHDPEATDDDDSVPFARPALDYGIDGPIGWVTIARVGSEFEANLIRLKLDAAGIPSGVPGSNAFGVHPAFQMAGLRVQVRRIDAERAAEMLQDTPAGRRLTADAVPRARRSVRAWARVAAVVIFATGAALLFAGVGTTASAALAAAGLLAAFALRPPAV